MFTMLFGIFSSGGGDGINLPSYYKIIANDADTLAYYRLNDTTTALVEELGNETSNGYYTGTYSQSAQSLILPTDIDTNNCVDFTAGLAVSPTDGSLEGLGSSTNYPQGYTICALVEMDTVNAARKTIVGKYDNESVLSGYMFIDANEKLAFRTRLYQGAPYAPEENGATTLTTGKIYHCCIRMGWSGNSKAANKGMNIFLDGKSDLATINWTSASSSNLPTTAWTIGALGGSSLPLDGKIDEVTFYSDTLDDTKIEYLANVALGKFNQYTMLYKFQDTPTPISWWRFNDASTSAKDTMGLHDLAELYSGGTYQAEGTPNSGEDYGYFMPGTTNVGAFSKTVTNAYQYSTGAIECWVKPDSTGSSTRTIFSLPYTSDYNKRFRLVLNSNQGIIHLDINKSSVDLIDVYGESAVAFDNRWHHIVVQSTGTAYEVYVDGVLGQSVGVYAGTGAAGDWISDVGNNDRVVIGADILTGGVWSHFFDGDIDELKVYDETLTAANIAEIYKFGMGYQGKIHRLGYVGHWVLGERSGTTASDMGGNYNGTYTSIASLYNPGGTLSHAPDFNSSTPSYVSVADNAALKWTTGAISIAAWIKPDSGTGIIVNKGGSTSNDGTYLFQTSGTNKIKFSFYRGSGANEVFDHTSTVNLTDGLWHHVAVTHVWGDASSTALYIDGALMTGGAWTGQDGTGTPSTNTEVLKIGARSNDSLIPFDGGIQQVTLSDRYFSEYDISNIYLDYALDPIDNGRVDAVVYEQVFEDYNDSTQGAIDTRTGFTEWGIDDTWGSANMTWYGNVASPRYFAQSGASNWGLSYLKNIHLYGQNIRVSSKVNGTSTAVYMGVTMHMPTPDVDDDANNGYAFMYYNNNWRIYQLTRYSTSQLSTASASGFTVTNDFIMSMEWRDGVIYAYAAGTLVTTYDTGRKFDFPGTCGNIAYHWGNKFFDFKVEYI